MGVAGRAARKPVVDLFGRDRCAIVEGEEPKKRARRPARLQPGVEPRLERIARFITDPACHGAAGLDQLVRSEEHTSELQSLMRIPYAVFCLKNKKTNTYTQ